MVPAMYNKAHPEVTINYQAVGSGLGRAVADGRER